MEYTVYVECVLSLVTLEPLISIIFTIVKHRIILFISQKSSYNPLNLQDIIVARTEFQDF